MPDEMKASVEGNIPVEFHGIEIKTINHRVWGEPANALIVNMPESRTVLSSREGLKTIKTVCNCYLPKSTWGTFEANPESWNDYLNEILNEAGLSVNDAAALSTGVSMDCLAWQEESFEELRVMALVTAGVATNAMRIGLDKAGVVEREGSFEKTGTINTILLCSPQLDLTAMASSFITITEAKNVALQELDVRSTYNPQWQATGTGTDQIVIVPGEGPGCTYVGGHTKIGELMARAVTSATISSIRKSL